MAQANTDYLIPARVLEGDFAGWLRDAMAARRISTRMLAIRAGIDHTTIYRVVAGQRRPSLATAAALLRILTHEPTRFEPGAREQVDDTAEAVGF